MTYLVIFGIGAGVLAFVGFLVMLAARNARLLGRAEVEAEHERQSVDAIHKADSVLLEPRSDDDTLDRLQSGGF